MGLAKQDSLQQPQILHKYIRTLKTDVTNASFIFHLGGTPKNAKFSKVPSASKRKERPPDGGTTQQPLDPSVSMTRSVLIKRLYWHLTRPTP